MAMEDEMVGGGHMDHSKMDHGAVSHAPPVMDTHTGHILNGGIEHGGHDSMLMYFHFGHNVTVLFSFWHVTTVWGLVGSCVGIFLLAIVYEGLKVFREYLLHQTLVCGTVVARTSASHGDQSRFRGPDDGANGGRTLLTANANGEEGGLDRNKDDSVVIVRNVLKPHPLSFPHFLQTILHMIQLVVSYFLMLIFMTFNVWLCTAVTLGVGAGYFLFGWRKKTVIDVNECCH